MTQRGASEWRDGCPHEAPCWCSECKKIYMRNYMRAYEKTRWVKGVCVECAELFLGSLGRLKCDTCKGPKRPAGRPCECCGEAFAPKSSKAKYCSKVCVDRAKGQRMPRPELVVRQCRWCCLDFPTTLGSVCCSAECHSALTTHMDTWKAPDRCHIPLCRDCGAPTCGGPNSRLCVACMGSMRAVAIRGGERITLRGLFDRDGGICHLCGGKARWNVTSHHEKYPNIDHLVPISKGGEHTWANVALAHRGCNIRRGNRGGDVQLRLVG